ncbi:MAG: hypothetical protein DCC68_22810 [Planctomycetota bacterium]|nr:MAG: hypothetical protein DCC68_22810 [Planctomycetota bacterium]
MSNRVCWRLLAAVAFLAFGRGSGADELCDVPAAWLHDAELRDVQFVDAEHGWAVGALGVVWRTEDGGKVWHLARTPVACRLETVSFADAQRGWIAGGDAMPYVHTSRGVVLATVDGGRTWTNELRTDLPRIWKLQLRGEAGWAFGEASALYGGGIFTTRDAGRTWAAAVPDEALPAWTAADSPRGDFAVIAAANGVYGVAPGGRAKLAAGPALAVSRPRRIEFADATDGWLVGDRGLLLRTRDGGETWQDMRERLPDRAGRHFDLHALEVRGRDVWIAGSPGTLVWHSADDGETWTARPTGQTAPIEAIAFVDRHRGWAVGALGRVLATRDGGHRWRGQLGSAERAALLGVHATSEDVPLAAYAQSEGNDGFLAHAIVMHEPYRSAGRESQDAASRRFCDALAAVGASGETASRFPLPEDAALWSTAALVEAWNQASARGDADAMTQYEELLVRAIRTWRPEAIATHDPANAAGKVSLRALVASAVLNATQKAADPLAYPEQLAQAGLRPWRVKRVFGALPPGEPGPIELPPTKVAPRLGLALGEAIRPALGMLEAEYRPAESAAFRTLVDHAPNTGGRREFFAAAASEEARDARRETDVSSPASLSAVQQRLVARRNAQGILAQAAKNRTSTLGWLGQLDALATGLDDEGTAEVVRQLADQFETSGQWETAAEAHRVITQRYAKTPLGPPSLAWLVAYESSSEIALRRRANPGYAVRPASAEEATADGSDREAAAGSSRRVGPLLALVAQADARFAAEAEIRFPLAAIERNAASGRASSNGAGPFAALADLRLGEAWSRLAAAEKWREARHGKPPVAVWRCGTTAEKPYLDGKLDDKLWQQATPIALAGVAGGDVRWTRDSEFLFVAGRFSVVRGTPPQTTIKPAAGRDADLSDADRVELAIDVDRDYATWFSLAVDASGRTNDRCGRDATWTPQWFVVTREADAAWTFEAAIPLSELCRPAPESGGHWSVAARRLTPGVGVQSASNETALRVGPAAFGWIEFE